MKTSKPKGRKTKMSKTSKSSSWQTNDSYSLTDITSDSVQSGRELRTHEVLYEEKPAVQSARKSQLFETSPSKQPLPRTSTETSEASAKSAVGFKFNFNALPSIIFGVDRTSSENTVDARPCGFAFPSKPSICKDLPAQKCFSFGTPQVFHVFGSNSNVCEDSKKQATSAPALEPPMFVQMKSSYGNLASEEEKAFMNVQHFKKSSQSFDNASQQALIEKSLSNRGSSSAKTEATCSVEPSGELVVKRQNCITFKPQYASNSLEALREEDYEQSQSLGSTQRSSGVMSGSLDNVSRHSKQSLGSKNESKVSLRPTKSNGKTSQRFDLNHNEPFDGNGKGKHLSSLSRPNSSSFWPTAGYLKQVFIINGNGNTFNFYKS